MTDTNAGMVPFSQEAEEATLGGVLTSPEMYGECAKLITANDFYLVRNQRIWESLSRLHEAETIVDLTMVSEDLRQAGMLDEIGGYGYLIHLLNTTPNSYHAPAYAGLVATTAKRRKLLQIADQIRALAMDEALKYSDVFSRAQAALDVARPTDKTKHLQGAHSLQLYDEIIMQRDKDRRNGKSMLAPIPAGWHAMVNKMHAFRQDDLVVLGGPSGSGKSAMAECLAEFYALNGDLVSYTHTEMSHDNLMDRRMARHSGLPYHLLLQGDVVDGLRGDLYVKTSEEMQSFAPNLTYDWMPNVLFPDLATHWRDMYDAGYRKFFLDHFQDVSFPRVPGSGDQNFVADYARLAVWLAAFVEKRKDATVFVLSQLNKEGDIKGGLKLLEKATVVMTFNRPTLSNELRYMYQSDPEVQLNPGEDSPVADIKIDKHRFGAKGKFRMFYHGPRFAWMDTSSVRMSSMDAATPRISQFPSNAKREAN